MTLYTCIFLVTMSTVDYWNTCYDYVVYQVKYKRYNTTTYVTGPEKTGVIYTKYTCSYYGTYILFCICYATYIDFIEFLGDFCVTIRWHFRYNTDYWYKVIRSQKLGQILHVGKTGCQRPSSTAELSCQNGLVWLCISPWKSCVILMLKI